MNDNNTLTVLKYNLNDSAMIEKTQNGYRIYLKSFEKIVKKKNKKNITLYARVVHSKTTTYARAQ